MAEPPTGGDGRNSLNLDSTMGSIGQELGQLEHPAFAATLPCGEVVISEMHNHRLTVFDKDARADRILGAQAKLKWPAGVAYFEEINRQGSIFVADSGHHRVLRLCVHTGAVLASTEFTTKLSYPYGLAHAAGLLFVSDGTDRVLALQPEDLSLAHVIGRGTGSGAGELNGPQGLTVSGGRLFVCDSKNHRIAVFSVAEAHGTHTWGSHLYNLGGEGSTPGRFEQPRGVAVVQERLYVAEWGNGGRLQALELAPPHAPLQVVPSAAGRLWGLAADERRERLVVVNVEAHQVLNMNVHRREKK